MHLHTALSFVGWMFKKLKPGYFKIMPGKYFLLLDKFGCKLTLIFSNFYNINSSCKLR